MNTEEEPLNAFVLSPGWVQTELGNNGANFFGMKEAPVTIDDSCTQMLKVIDGATKESHGGRFWGHEGDELAW